MLASALKVLPAASSAPLLIQPVAAACAAWIIFGERLAPMQMLGAAIVLAAIIVCQRSAAPTHPAPAVADTGTAVVPRDAS